MKNEKIKVTLELSPNDAAFVKNSIACESRQPLIDAIEAREKEQHEAALGTNWEMTAENFPDGHNIVRETSFYVTLFLDGVRHRINMPNGEICSLMYSSRHMLHALRSVLGADKSSVMIDKLSCKTRDTINSALQLVE